MVGVGVRRGISNCVFFLIRIKKDEGQGRENVTLKL